MVGQIRHAHRVGDDEDVGLGGVLSSGLGEVADDGGVGVEQVVAGHAGLAGNTSGDDNDLGALEGLGEAGGSGIVALDLRSSMAALGRSAGAAYLALGVDVANVGSDTCELSVGQVVGMPGDWLVHDRRLAYRVRGGCRRGRAC